MNTVIFKRIAIGLGIYIAIVLAVFNFYEDDPSSMDWQDREQFNKVKISKLALGTSKQEIIDMLGSPDISEAKMVNEDTVQVMFYRTQHRVSDGITTEDECTPLLFKNDVLIAWGDGTYQQYLDNQ